MQKPRAFIKMLQRWRFLRMFTQLAQPITAAQVQQDAENLYVAVCHDTNALRVNMVAQGYDPKLVDEATSKIIERSFTSMDMKGTRPLRCSSYLV
ncbi:hypothetical protein EGO53_23220 [Serratia liquefaciens]|uniref:Uncharacterized protein n=1 Tax=Serratia liquefaciens TaxID=614 RepID=A0A515D262_SERLI|nr:hypothetical protein EGO53_23220 [Serratia liquefaciens]